MGSGDLGVIACPGIALRLWEGGSQDQQAAGRIHEILSKGVEFLREGSFLNSGHGCVTREEGSHLSDPLHMSL